ncbi:hypothetical protein RFI_03623, partial [Reticulomyxa filosa]
MSHIDIYWLRSIKTRIAQFLQMIYTMFASEKCWSVSIAIKKHKTTKKQIIRPHVFGLDFQYGGKKVGKKDKQKLQSREKKTKWDNINKKARTVKTNIMPTNGKKHMKQLQAVKSGRQNLKFGITHKQNNKKHRHKNI